MNTIMRIKNIIMITAVICVTAELYSQPAQQYPYPLQAIYNQARAGDKIVKQELEYKDAGRAGENVVWDFGQLTTLDEHYVGLNGFCEMAIRYFQTVKECDHNINHFATKGILQNRFYEVYY